MTVEIDKNDILLEKVEAIVNPTYSYLNNYSSITRDLLKIGGPQIQMEFEKHTKESGPLSTGSVYLTSAGAIEGLNYVIHTVGP